MTMQKLQLKPTKAPEQKKPPVMRQVAALCYRVTKGKPEVLLITSRGSERWIVPKGWQMSGKSDAESARIEAWEEAGVTGKVADEKIGTFSYQKMMSAEAVTPCKAAVFPLQVKELADKFPEVGQRKRKWFSPKKAAKKVAEPDLADLLRRFKPPKSKR